MNNNDKNDDKIVIKHDNYTYNNNNNDNNEMINDIARNKQTYITYTYKYYIASFLIAFSNSYYAFMDFKKQTHGNTEMS